MSKCLKFCAQGLKFEANFHSKMSVCGHELGLTPPPNPFTNSVLLRYGGFHCCTGVLRYGG